MINLLMTLFSFTFLSSAQAVTLIPMNLKERPLAPRANECQLCHIKRQHHDAFISPKNVTTKEHFEIEISHGSLKKSCNDCHDVNNSNKLFAPATFENTSLLCARCHSLRYIEWQKGLHGKKITSWKNNVAFHCIDCHNPHSVSFKPMESKPAPRPLSYPRGALEQAEHAEK